MDYMTEKNEQLWSFLTIFDHLQPEYNIGQRSFRVFNVMKIK